MGKSMTPKYRMVIDGNYMTWQGRASVSLLEDLVKAYAASLEIGGCNEHISKSLGHIPYPNKARIETNSRDPRVICVWEAAKFQCW